MGNLRTKRQSPRAAVGLYMGPMQGEVFVLYRETCTPMKLLVLGCLPGRKERAKSRKEKECATCDLGPLKQETDEYHSTPRAEAYTWG